MANVIINIDTEKQTIKASVNEKNVSDIRYIYVNKYIPYNEKEEKVIVDIVSNITDEENGISRTVTITCAGDEVNEKDTLLNDLQQMLKIS